MARPKKGRRGEKPQWRARMKTWVARVWEADGSCSGWVNLGTSDKEQALKIYERWLQTGERPKEPSQETFEKAASRIVDQQEQEGDLKPKQALKRRSRLRKFAFPRIGMVEVATLQPHHVSSVLDAMARPAHLLGDDMSKGTILAMRSDISQVLAQLQREGVIADNWARSMSLSKKARVDTRRRCCLTDEQVLLFQKKRGFNTQLDLAVLFCRQIAGHRTSDILAARWEHCSHPDFATMKVRRPKTDGETGAKARGGRKARAYELIDHEVDKQFRKHLRAYWMAAGQPKSGPIFPNERAGVATAMKLKDGRVIARRGSEAGAHKRGDGGNSFAESFRKAVWEAEIYEPMEAGTLIGGEPLREGFDPGKPDKALCRLQTDTDDSRRLDFQSLRGALVTALAGAKVELMDQLAITGHTQVTTQLKHYMGKRRVRVPAAALPGGAPEHPEHPEENQGPHESGFSPAALTDAQRQALVLLGILPGSGDSRDSIPRFGTKPPSQTSRSASK